MVKLAVKIKKLGVKRVDLTKDQIVLFLEYAMNDATQKLEKEFSLEDNAINFSIQYLREIKEMAKKSFPQPLASLEFEGGEEEVRDSLVEALRKILDKISELKSTKDHEQYLDMFHAVNSMQVEIR